MSRSVRLFLVVLLGIAGLSALAEEPPFAPVPASELVLADLLYQKRIVAVFADDPLDPNFLRQMALVAVNTADLVERDVIVVFDTDPAAGSALRTKLRPRGFALVILDKDGKVALRKPLPWDTREISRAIDKFPSRRDEVLLQGATP
ncbi:MAG: DUF4174 domain-containing protein [Paracoccaceae bacterium]